MQNLFVQLIKYYTLYNKGSGIDACIDNTSIVIYIYYLHNLQIYFGNQA